MSAVAVTMAALTSSSITHQHTAYIYYRSECLASYHSLVYLYYEQTNQTSVPGSPTKESFANRSNRFLLAIKMRKVGINFQRNSSPRAHDSMGEER